MLDGLHLLPTAMHIVGFCTNVQAGESVCIVTDPAKLRIAEALAVATLQRGANPVLCIAKPTKVHGGEPNRIVAAAMKAADVILAPTTFSITHTRSRIEATASGARTLILRSLTEDTFTTGAITADLSEIIELNQRLASRLSETDLIRVTTPLGSDLTFRVAGRPILQFDGLAREPGTMNGLPAGEVAVAPLEGSAHGTLVIDHFIDMVGRVDRPVSLVWESGRVTRVEGGIAADRLRDLWASSDSNAGNLAEFAIGTNSKSRMLGDEAEDKLGLGTIHVGLGDNHTIGGTVRSASHLDAVVLSPTVMLDGVPAIVDGRLTLGKEED